MFRSLEYKLPIINLSSWTCSRFEYNYIIILLIHCIRTFILTYFEQLKTFLLLMCFIVSSRWILGLQNILKHIVRLQYVYILHFLVSINTSNIIVAGTCPYNVDHACIFGVLYWLLSGSQILFAADKRAVKPFNALIL